jgi:hypothetical protein
MINITDPWVSNINCWASMYRVVLACHGIPVSAGNEAATDIANEFREHCTWHNNVICS